MKKPIILLLLLSLLLTPSIQSLGFNCKGRESNLEFCYDVNYDKTYCKKDYNCIYNSNRLPIEGLDIIYWPNISIWSFKVNKTEDLVLFYYLIDPSGKIIQGTPIFIDTAKIISGQSITSPTAIGGIKIPSNYPGIWEIKSILLKREDYLNNLNSSSFTDLKKEYDDTIFNSERVHILSYNEYLTEKIAKNSLYVSVLVLLVAIIMGFVTFYRDYKRQISLLESLHSELNAISSKEKKIRLLNKELFGYDLKPAHGIWKLNTQIYVEGLNEKIKFKKTRDLKKVLIHISQKIELVENYLIQYSQVPKEHQMPIKNAIMKVLKEVIELVETTKKFIEIEFGIGNLDKAYK